MNENETELFAFLETQGIKTQTQGHEAVFTVEQSTDLHERMPGGHTKNLFLKDKKGEIFLITAAHGTTVNLKTLHKLIQSGRLSFGKPELLLEVLGVTPGSVTALALFNDMPGPTRPDSPRINFILDHALLAHDVICCHPLRNTATTALKRDDLMRFVKLTGHEMRVIDFATETEIT